MPISDQDHAYQLKKIEERYENDLTELRNECDRRLAAIREATAALAAMKTENDRLRSQLKGDKIGAITNRVIEAASSLLSDIRWPREVAKHMMAGRIAKPPLEMVRALYAEELAFRDQVLEVCPEMARFSTASDGIARTFEGSSLETIRHMVASGIGITVLPMASIQDSQNKDSMLRYVPFSNRAPDRRVVIAWRKSFTRHAAIEAIRQAVLECDLSGVTMLDEVAQAQ